MWCFLRVLRALFTRKTRPTLRIDTSYVEACREVDCLLLNTCTITPFFIDGSWWRKAREDETFFDGRGNAIGVQGLIERIPAS